MRTFESSAVRRAAPCEHGEETCCDIAPPNHVHHRRLFTVIVFVFAVAACVALIGSTLQGFSDMGAAFPTGASLFQSAAWDRFFAGFGRVAALVLVLAAAVLAVRRRRRRAKKPQQER